MVRGERREILSQIDDQGDGVERHRAGEARHQRRPAGKKSGCGAVGAGKINVFAARRRKSSSQLRVRHGARQRETSTDNPQRQHRTGLRHQLCDVSRRGKNSGANDVGHDQGNAIADAKRAAQLIAHGSVAACTGDAANRLEWQGLADYSRACWPCLVLLLSGIGFLGDIHSTPPEGAEYSDAQGSQLIAGDELRSAKAVRHTAIDAPMPARFLLVSTRVISFGKRTYSVITNTFIVVTNKLIVTTCK